ncbi:Eukaryotic translation initiation factor 3 subunit M [Fonsecaea pedrosoi]|nr:Eukaryotic translation initiation factor 3 subunit M [Fonsecaea pedrosoi]
MPAPTNTLLIEGTFTELAEELAQYIDTLAKSEEGAGVQAEIGQLLSTIRESEQSQEPIDEAAVQSQKNEVLKKIVTKASVLNSAPEREFSAAYNLLISLSSQSSISDGLFSRICTHLSEQPVTSSPTYGGSLALQTLTTIFNVLPPTSESRYHVFLAILKVMRQTSSSQAFEALIPQLETNIPNWLSAWELDDEDARNLYVGVADVASATGNEDLQYTYLLSALQTIPPESASEAESAELARRALRVALTNPAITDFTPLTTSDAVVALRRSDSNLFDLLEIFSSDDYSSYTDFLETNNLADLGIPDSAAETLSHKIRLLTLATIAASSTTRSVPYSTIASALQIPSEDVEMWVIDTIRAGLVEGKLSQLKQEFLVQRATYRVFGEKQWAEIQGRLMVWRRSLESVLTVVRAEREKFLREGPTSNGDAGVNGYGGDGDGQRNGGERQQQRRQGGDRGGRGPRRDRGDQQQQQQGPREIEVGGGD